MKVEIPFNSWSKKRLLEHSKYATSRSKVYGQAGDSFEVRNNTHIWEFKIDGVVRLPYWFILQYLYKAEGAESPEELSKVFTQIMRGKEPDVGTPFWTHFLRPYMGRLIKHE